MLLIHLLILSFCRLSKVLTNFCAPPDVFLNFQGAPTCDYVSLLGIVVLLYL